MAGIHTEAPIQVLRADKIVFMKTIFSCVDEQRDCSGHRLRGCQQDEEYGSFRPFSDAGRVCEAVQKKTLSQYTGTR